MLVPFLIALLLLLAALGMVRWRVAAIRAILSRASSWPSTPGTILVSRLENGEDNDIFFAVFRPRVEYEYSVAGRTYRSDRIWLRGRPPFGFRSFAEATLAQFPAGTTVKVFHHPNEPEVSALVLESSESAIWRGASGGLMIAIVALIFASLFEPGIYRPQALIEADIESIMERMRRAMSCEAGTVCN